MIEYEVRTPHCGCIVRDLGPPSGNNIVQVEVTLDSQGTVPAERQANQSIINQTFNQTDRIFTVKFQHTEV